LVEHYDVDSHRRFATHEVDLRSTAAACQMEHRRAAAVALVYRQPGSFAPITSTDSMVGGADSSVGA
jgi:hypothetical protein